MIMNKRKLNQVFRKIKEECQFDYAVTDADQYGDCNTCVNHGLGIEFGFDSKGIWTKHWLKGMNKGCSWKELDGVHVGHDITEEQAKIMIRVLEANGYEVKPQHYDETKCFYIKEREIR